jgi:hypothetical protein
LGYPSFHSAFDRAGMNPPTVGLVTFEAFIMSFPVWVYADCPTCLYVRLGNLRLRAICPKVAKNVLRTATSVLGFKWARSPLIRSLGGMRGLTGFGRPGFYQPLSFRLLARLPEPSLQRSAGPLPTRSIRCCRRPSDVLCQFLRLAQHFRFLVPATGCESGRSRPCRRCRSPSRRARPWTRLTRSSAPAQGCAAFLKSPASVAARGVESTRT